MIILISRAPIGREAPAETGTSDRIIAHHYKTVAGALRYAARYAAERKAYRVEFFRDGRLYAAPYLTVTKII